MPATPSSRAILRLYRTTLRTSQSFSSYNFRNYFLRRTKDVFRTIQTESDPDKLRSLYADATADLTVLRRSAIVNQLYGGWRLVVEDQEKEVLTRSDS